MSDSEDEYHGQQKVCIVGDTNTGKVNLSDIKYLSLIYVKIFS